MKPKLTLSDLFWLVVVCALRLGWWLDRRRFEEIKDRNRVLENWMEMAESVGF